MGLERECRCRWLGGETVVKALLESRELILRGALKRTIPIAAMSKVQATGAELTFAVDGETYALALGDGIAERWAAKIATPPPGLAKKLGLGPHAKALVIGPVEAPELLEALTGCRAKTAKDAVLGLAVVADAATLKRALVKHSGLPAHAPIWIVHGKGPRAPFGETPVRAAMRAEGYIDTKVSSVSAALTATRYSKPRG